MAICAHIDAVSGALIPDTTPIDQCTAYVIATQSDYLAFSLFNIPDTSVLSAAWFAGFVVPMTAHMVAWAVGSLVNFFNERK